MEIDTDLHTLSLPDALPICTGGSKRGGAQAETEGGDRARQCAQRPSWFCGSAQRGQACRFHGNCARHAGHSGNESQGAAQKLQRNGTLMAAMCLNMSTTTRRKWLTTARRSRKMEHSIPYAHEHHNTLPPRGAPI